MIFVAGEELESFLLDSIVVVVIAAPLVETTLPTSFLSEPLSMASSE